MAEFKKRGVYKCDCLPCKKQRERQNKYYQTKGRIKRGRLTHEEMWAKRRKEKLSK